MRLIYRAPTSTSSSSSRRCSKSRHVGRAADRLNLSPSAVSHGLGRLRRLLNDPLFLRTPKGVVPTARAIDLAEPIADILARVRSVISTSEPFDPATSTRRFTIGAPDGVSAVFLPPLLDVLRSAHSRSISASGSFCRRRDDEPRARLGPRARRARSSRDGYRDHSARRSPGAVRRTRPSTRTISSSRHARPTRLRGIPDARSLLRDAASRCLAHRRCLRLHRRSSCGAGPLAADRGDRSEFHDGARSSSPRPT